MANTKSALKRDRQTAARTDRNKSVKTRIKTARRAVLVALEKGDAKDAAAKFNALASAADKAVKSNVIHKNAAGRIKSILGARVAAKASAPAAAPAPAKPAKAAKVAKKAAK